MQFSSNYTKCERFLAFICNFWSSIGINTEPSGNIEEVEINLCENLSQRIVDILLAILSNAEFCVREDCSKLVILIVLRSSNSQLRTLSHIDIVSGFLNTIHNSSDEDVISMLQPMHRLCISLGEINGHENIEYDYESNNGKEILDELLESENEEIVEEAKVLISDVYNIEFD